MASVYSFFLIKTGREGLPITLSNRWAFVHLLMCSNGWWWVCTSDSMTTLKIDSSELGVGEKYVHLNQLRLRKVYMLYQRELEQTQQREEGVIQLLEAKIIQQISIGKGYPSFSMWVEDKVLRVKGFARVLNCGFGYSKLWLLLLPTDIMVPLKISALYVQLPPESSFFFGQCRSAMECAQLKFDVRSRHLHNRPSASG
ncbi:hypothetical protein Tco_1202110 [Tanacetum coccineum]